MARIALLTPNPLTSFGGVERFGRYLTASLKEAGHVVDIFDRTRADVVPPSGWDRFGMAEPRLARAIGDAFQKANRVQAYDLVFSNGMFGYAAGRVNGINMYHGIYAGFTRGVRLSLNWRDVIRLGYVRTHYERQSGMGKHIVAVSRATADEVRRYYGFEVGSVIPNAVDLEHFRPLPKEQARQRLGLPLAGKLLLFTGRMEFRKGFDVLAQLATELRGKARLVIATDVSATDCPIEDAIVLTNVDYESLPDLYSACDAFVFPTRYEGCSYSLIEAMACGCAPVTTQVGQAHDIAMSDDVLADAIVQPEDWSSFTRATLRIIHDEDWRGELAKRSRTYAVVHHDLAKWQQAYVTLIRSLLGEK